MLTYNYRSYYLKTEDSKLDPLPSFRDLPFATCVHKRTIPSLHEEEDGGLTVILDLGGFFLRKVLPCLVLSLDLPAFRLMMVTSTPSTPSNSLQLQWSDGLSITHLCSFRNVSEGAVVAIVVFKFWILLPIFAFCNCGSN